MLEKVPKISSLKSLSLLGLTPRAGTLVLQGALLKISSLADLHIFQTYTEDYFIWNENIKESCGTLNLISYTLIFFKY